MHCDHIGLFLRGLGDNVAEKLPKYSTTFGAILKSINLKEKTALATFLASFGKIWPSPLSTSSHTANLVHSLIKGFYPQQLRPLFADIR